jgi:maltose alpha-D-glucosyltransferase/alpha-amylase
VSESNNDSLWYKDIIVYQLHVKCFKDSNGDGVGDFRGLIEKLDYIQDLGVTAIWLLPFYPSPLRDDGYDIADYTSVHPTTARCGRSSASCARPIAATAGDHRAGDQPHLRPAPLVSGGARMRPPGRPSATSTCGATPTRSFPRRASSSPTPRRPTGPGIRWPGLLLASLLLAPARSQPQQPAGGASGDSADATSGSTWGRWAAPRRDPLPLCARGDEQREPPRDPSGDQAAAGGDGRASTRIGMLLAEANQWPEDAREYFGDGDECHMNLSLPADAAAVHGRGPGGPLSRSPRSSPDAGHPGTASGRSSCVTTTS